MLKGNIGLSLFGFGAGARIRILVSRVERVGEPPCYPEVHSKEVRSRRRNPKQKNRSRP